jgi:hypothetical protein
MPISVGSGGSLASKRTQLLKPRKVWSNKPASDEGSVLL